MIRTFAGDSTPFPCHPAAGLRSAHEASTTNPSREYVTSRGVQQLGRRMRDAMLVIDLHRTQRVFTLRRRSARGSVARGSVRQAGRGE